MLQPGSPSRHGNAAVIAAGTGLGEALLLNVDGRFVPGASEGGHADFAARTPRELEMVARAHAHLRPRQRRARALGSRPRQHLPVHARRVRHRADAHAPQHRAGAAVRGRRRGRRRRRSCRRASAAAAAERRCAQCVEAMEMFVCDRTAPRRATSRCAPWRPPASTSAAASRRRSCRRSRPVRSWTRSSPRRRWTSSLRRFPSP